MQPQQEVVNPLTKRIRVFRFNQRNSPSIYYMCIFSELQHDFSLFSLVSDEIHAFVTTSRPDTGFFREAAAACLRVDRPRLAAVQIPRMEGAGRRNVMKGERISAAEPSGECPAKWNVPVEWAQAPGRRSRRPRPSVPGLPARAGGGAAAGPLRAPGGRPR